MSTTTCFPNVTSSTDSNYLNATNEQVSANQSVYRNKLLNQPDLSIPNSSNLAQNVIQNSKSDILISGNFDSFQLSRTTTPLPYLTTNSSLDGYFNSNSTLSTPNPQLNNVLNATSSIMANSLTSRCHSSNSNCSTNSKLTNNLTSSRPGSSFGNFLSNNNDSDDSTQASGTHQTSHPASVVSYYPHIILNENNSNYLSNNLSNSMSNDLNNTTPNIHHSSNFNQQQVKEEYQLENYHQGINFHNNSDAQIMANSSNNLNNSMNSDHESSNLDQFSSNAAGGKSTSKKRRPKIPGGPPARPQCVECGKDFSNQSALSKHKLTHSDERKFVCRLCSKAFKRQDHLNGHLYTHRTIKPYQCDIKNCEKTYCDARSLKRHKENHHAIFCQLNLPLLSKNLPADLATNLMSAIKTTDGSRIQYAPASNGGDSSNDQSEVDLSNAIIDPNLLDLTDKSQSTLLQQLITQTDGNPTALSILQQHIAEQQSNSVPCPTCAKKFKNQPALNGHMRLHGGRNGRSNNGLINDARQPLTNNENSDQRSNSQPLGESINKQHETQRNDGPIDLIKKEGLFVDLTNQSVQSNSDLNNSNNNVVKDKIRKQIANTPVIIENPEANRIQHQMIDNNNSRVQYYSNEGQQTNHLLSASVINANNPSPLVEQLQMDNNSSPLNNNEILHNDHSQDLINNEKIVHENSWFEDPNNVLHLKEQIQQQFRKPNLSQPLMNSIPNKPLNRCPTIPAHVFNTGEKFRRHSDSTAEILNQQNMNHSYHQQNGLVNSHTLNNNHQMDSIQSSSATNNQMQGINNGLHNQHLQQQQTPMDYESNSNQIENNNNLVNFEYLKRKQLRIDNAETSANDRTMETIPESQMVNSTSNTNTTSNANYLQPTNHLPNNNQHHQVFYNNNNNCSTTNQQLAYQSHSVPTTPTVVNQHFFNHERLDLNQQLNNHDYHEQLSNQISHHHPNGHQLNPPHSLPCTPKQQPTSFTFSPHQVQHYQQQDQQQSYHNHYGSSPNTPITPCTPVTPTNCSNQQYQDNLIGVQRQNNLHPSQTIQSNNQSANVHKNLNTLYPTVVEFNNNTICPRTGKYDSQHNLNYSRNMIGNHQFLDSNDNHITTTDHLNNTYSTILNEDYMVTETAPATYNEPQQQFSNCMDHIQRNLNYQLNNSCSNTSGSNYSNVIMSNYANASSNNEPSFCQTTNIPSHNCTNQLNQSSNNNMLMNEEMGKENGSNAANNQSINCAAATTPDKPYTRVTLRSVSPNLVIETDSFKNSTADDSQNPMNSLNAEDEDDDVFLKPTEINTAPISSPKNSFLNNGIGTCNKKPKVHINLASGTYLAGTNVNHSSSNLPQVDFTHPQQPKLAPLTTNTSSKDEHNRKTAENHLNDINFNQIKFNSFEKEKDQVNLINSSSSVEFENSTNTSSTKQQTSRTNSPKRTKHRPEPLCIPPHVNARIHESSRVWLNNASNQPYTPPPMLSPRRTISSCYWHILSGNLTPKTITNFFGSKKNLEHQQMILNQAASIKQQSIGNKNRFDFLNTNNDNYIQTPVTAYEPLDSCLPNVETTFDFSTYSSANAHVNIGSRYQARIPAFNPNKEEAKLHYKNERASKVWSPTILDNRTPTNNHLDDYRQCKTIANSKRKSSPLKELELYLELSCSACIVGNGRNKEYAYHILYQNNGNFNKSIRQLLNAQPIINPDHPLYNYKYAETDVWTCDEIQSYYNALLKYDKDFLTISKQLENKSVKQCIEFYYLWKKVCSDDYKRHRVLRRKKEQEGLFCVNSKE